MRPLASSFKTLKTAALCAALVLPAALPAGAADARSRADAFAHFLATQRLTQRLSHAAPLGIFEDGVPPVNSVLRNVQLDFNSSLGRRDWHTGISALGSVDENPEDATLWQMRAYAAEDSAAGFNTGLLYRTARQNDMFGLNAFLDFERSKYDESFVRYSLGGEYRRKALNVFANYYKPLTDTKPNISGGPVYTREGYDVEVEVSDSRIEEWSGFMGLAGGLAYYNFNGELGDSADIGARAFIRADNVLAPVGSGNGGGALRFRADIDSPHGDSAALGVQLVYAIRLDAPADARPAVSASDDYDPRAGFYAMSRREHKQRVTQ